MHQTRAGLNVGRCIRCTSDMPLKADAGPKSRDLSKQQRNQIPLPVRLVLFPATPVLPSSVHVLPCGMHDPVSPNGTYARPWALYLTSRSSRPSRASPTPAARLRTTMPRLSIRLWTPARALACVMLIENSLPTDGTKRLSPACCACV